MPENPDLLIHDTLVTAVTLLIVAYGLIMLVRRLQVSRPGLAIATPLMVAFAVRVLCSIGVSLTGFGDALRGNDEGVFLAQAQDISQSGLGSSEWIDALGHQLHIFVFATQISAWDAPDLALRIVQIGIAVAGLALFAGAAFELGGPRAAVISSWLLAFEPTGIFFSSTLHKESVMFLAGGLVAFGGAMVWKREDLRYLLPIAAACLIAAATRGYAAWFLLAAAAAIVFHTGIRSGARGSDRSLILIALVVVLIAVTAPTVWSSTSTEALSDLQESQTANANDQSNLGLELVDYSSRGAIITNLPQRMYDVAARPYPWQIGNASQQIGVIGTLVAYSTLAFLLYLLSKAVGRRMELGGPFIYLLLFLFIAYSLSAGNAGTAFRYRTHLVATAIVLVSILWVARREQTASVASTESLAMAERRDYATAEPSLS